LQLRHASYTIPTIDIVSAYIEARFMAQSAEHLLPLTPLSLAVLLALTGEDRHGYALMKEIERQSEGRIKPGTGTLYAALQRMLEEGTIDLSAREPRKGEDARRRYYAITPLGRAVARAEVARLARVVQDAQALMGVGAGTRGRRA
jgi:DNA-binding PadR family transcriptional regulator